MGFKKNFKFLIREIKYYQRLEGSIKRIGIKFLLAKTFLKKWVNSSLYNFFYNKKIKKYTKKIKPIFLQIENTNLCNAKCIMCPHGSMKRKKEIMNQQDFEKILNKTMKDYPNIKTITITGIGEPMLDKGIIDKIKFVNKNYPNLHIDVYSNASAINKELINHLLETKLHKINFSINGTKKNYKKIMGLDYDVTEKNIFLFIKRKKELGKKYPLINISLMIMKENQEDVEEIQNLWLNNVDSIMIYSPTNWGGGKLNINSIVTNFKIKRWPCTDLWRYITINVTGDIVMCRRDYESKIKLGNLLKQGAKEIFEGDKINKLREKHLHRNFSIPLCNKCDIIFDSSLNWWNKE